MLFVHRFLFGSEQWRTQELFMGTVSISGIWWTFVFGVRCFWRHSLTSHSVVILEWKKWEDHCRAKEKVGGAT